ncbi:transglycosylase domain-containing protein [Saccharothrix violaceirubra]|uniref:Membrane peptidoglycan carboxypeptidase n=1 Tax=Saccharothrix violaceirubra TaxID=413306 RepID=A0A7W7TB44_9PSEU|nr:transglycosylase domain-containing protein [Saccharothrix violaceirubra]MBB4969357.1 membrane peptidoglycan carboxypeptidase [Saccharothrix violaceirubra]
MNDQYDDRQRGGEPQWPTGEDPDGGAQRPDDRPRGGPGPRQGTPPGGFDRPRGGPAPGQDGGPGGQRRPAAPGPNGSRGPGPGDQGGPGPRTGGRPGPAGQGGPNGPRPGPNGPGGPGPNGPGPVPGGPGPHSGPGPNGGQGTQRMDTPPQRPAPPGGVRRPMGPGGPVPPGGRGPGGPRRPGGPGPDRRPGEEPTELLPSAHQSSRREPELLTHREDELLVDPVDDDEEYEDDDELTDEEQRKQRRKKIWRRVRRTSYVLLGLMILGPVVAFAIAYQVVTVPVPEEVAANQNKAVTILYANGDVMTKIAPNGANRTMIKYEDLPEHVKQAIYAAEDPTFETNPGFDFTALARAGWYQVTGRDSGGSGLTQQYVKKATENDAPTLSRKFTEIVKAYKMSKQQGKEEILTAYLNTIYFGRSAYGIKTAAYMYFGKNDLKELTPSEAALLAGMIQNPSKSENTQYSKDRWEYTMRQMLKFKWIDQAYFDSQTYPAPKPLEELQQHGLDGTDLFIRTMVMAELEAKGGFTESEALRSGITIHTTIDPVMQDKADAVIKNVMKGQPENLRYSMSAIDPTTGAVRVYWAGTDLNIDYQTGTLQEPGSSFKPFDFVAALKQGEGAGEVYDGSSPREFPGRTGRNAVFNSPNVACEVPKHCSVREAMVRSVNTVFFDMVATKYGPQAVADSAFGAGIPKEVELADGPHKLLAADEKDGGVTDANISIGGGTTRVRPFDMTAAYASFASRGVYREPFFISKITDAAGDTVYTHVDKSKPAFDADQKKSEDIADNVTDVLKDIPGRSKNTTCSAKRACAGKTGTHEKEGSSENTRAWMVGYTPSLSVGVYMGSESGKDAIKNAKGEDVYGSGLPGQIWRDFIDQALADKPSEPFAKPNPIGKLSAAPVVPSTTAPKTTTPERTSQTPTTTSEPEETTDRPTGTKPTRPCMPPLCPTGTTQPTKPTLEPTDPIGNGRREDE